VIKYEEYGLAKRDLALPDRVANMYYVYCLKSLNFWRFYIGYSTDLRARFEKHNNKEVLSTKPHAPWDLVYYEAYKEKLVATKREKQLKLHAAKEDLLIRLGFLKRNDDKI
jgi:putative endonuclease